MTFMKRISLILIFLIACSFVGPVAMGKVPDGNFQAKLVGERVNHDYVGNPAQMYISQWLAGEIFLENGQSRNVQALIYNGFHDELVYRTPDIQYVKLEKERIKGFTLGNDMTGEPLVFEKIRMPDQSPGKPEWIYAQVLHQDALTLYAFRRTISGGKEVLRQGDQAFERRLYKSDTLYFLKLANGQWYSFNRLRGNTLQELFPSHSAQIRNIRRRHQIRMRNNEQELIRFIQLLEPVIADQEL